MSNVQLFRHPAFGEVEVIVIEGKEWFGATQTAKALGYSNPHDALSKHCRKEGVAKREVLTNGGMQQMKFISEGNLYRLITKSKLPTAEQFESWVFDEVLPSIRKHGAYMTPETIEKTLSNPDFIIGLATKLKEEQLARQLAETQIEKDKPKVLFADSVSASQTSLLIGDLAKLIKQNGYDVGQKRLFEWMRQNGYLMKSGSSKNMPTQKAMDKELFEVKESSIANPDGSIRITKTTKVTGKGQIYFINKFISGDVA
ncbi:phage antirepressor KilAC domain-containing protein [Brevibacillus laterosporus]|uniref:phage antirepressor n=1 Tax=Brevibacillus laterosporus TaxID=1465 RepID=UPI002E233C81|nr:phage antirepressor KilAC domain-containing protein [Brevibacillus laterosporus]MED1790345.1 phage antirepressor KilAC domain-containing protein [Brevibacillus laterosporus]